MQSYFKNKNIIITGASKGIGLKLVYSFLTLGANVAGIARTKKLLDEILENARNLPGKFIGVECDLTCRDSVYSALTLLVERIGIVDILINNAGAALVGPLLDTKKEELEKVFALNFFSAVFCIDFIAPKMIAHKGGIIVNVSSIAAKYGLPTCGFYSAAKAALSCYAQALRTELAPAGIHVLTVYPGNTETEFHGSVLKTEGYTPHVSRQKKMSPDFVADEILKAIMKRKTEVIVGLSAKILYLFKSIAPSFLERLLVKEFNITQWYGPKPTSLGKNQNFVDENIQTQSHLLGMEKPCHYHRKTGSLDGSLLPNGLSPSLYYYLYPYLLSITYGGDIPPNQGFKNPLDDKKNGKNTVYIRKSPPPLSECGKNMIKALLSPLKKYARLVTSPQIETKEGTFPFDLGYDRTSCPAALRSQFPSLVRQSLRNKKHGQQTAWQVSCPDHIKNLVFGGQSEKEQEHDDSFHDSICHWGADAEIESVCSVNGPCSALGNSKTLDEIAQKLNFPCPMLLNTLYGYYVTLVNGGGMAFYTETLESAIAQCPSTKSRVAVEISRDGEMVNFKAIEVNGQECPRGIVKGDRFSLPSNPKKNTVCLEAVNSIFLACGLAEYSENPLKVSCVLDKCNASWRVTSKCSKNV